MEGTQGSVEVAEVSEYELRREVRMAENSEALRAMGFDETECQPEEPRAKIPSSSGGRSAPVTAHQ
jgi:hypothetical protein